MNAVQLKAAQRQQLIALRETNERMRDMVYLRKAGAKGISVA